MPGIGKIQPIYFEEQKFITTAINPYARHKLQIPTQTSLTNHLEFNLSKPKAHHIWLIKYIFSPLPCMELWAEVIRLFDFSE